MRGLRLAIGPERCEDIVGGNLLTLLRNQEREASPEARKFAISLEAPKREIDERGDRPMLDEMVELLIALGGSAGRRVDAIIAVHCPSHVAQVRCAAPDSLQADDIVRGDCLAAGRKKSRSIVRDEANGLKALEGVAIEGLS